MISQLKEICRPADKTQLSIPLVVAGDVLHRWDSPAELVNFLLRHMFPFYAIPGQHDLPHHRYEDIERSAYWTLVEAGLITNLVPGSPLGVSLVGAAPVGVMCHAFPWGFPVTPLDIKTDNHLDVAVVHDYIWQDGSAHKDASEAKHRTKYLPRLAGYDVALFGDNHQPFLTTMDSGGAGPIIYNHGATQRRRTDEVSILTQVGILWDDGLVTPHLLDRTETFCEPELKQELEAAGLDAEELLDLVRHLGDQVVSYQDALKHQLAKPGVTEPVRQHVLSWLEAAGGQSL